jgi:molybdopterin-guanine dinucleotide biosynthesis protein A
MQLLDGRPMVSWVIDRLAPQVDELRINANQNRAAYESFGYPVFADDIADFAGPLAGLHAALQRSPHPLIVTAPCDSPFMPTDLVVRLHAGLIEKGADLAVARAFEQMHPVFCLCRRELLAGLTDYLAGGGRRIDRWHSSLNVVIVSFDDEAEAFRNINTAEELDNSRSLPFRQGDE